MDAAVLLDIGACPFPLARSNEEDLGHLEHNLGKLGRILCQDQGAVEAATQAMGDLLSCPWADADAFVDEVLEGGSLPLIHRLIIALRTVRERSVPELSAWAHELLGDRVVPAMITERPEVGQGPTA